MDEHGADMAINHGEDFGIALWLVLGHQHIAQRDRDRNAARFGGGHQRLQLEGELPAAEGKHFDQQKIGMNLDKPVQQDLPAPGAPGIVDGLSPLVMDGGELCIGGQGGRQLHQRGALEIHLTRRRPAGNEGDIEAAVT